MGIPTAVEHVPPADSIYGDVQLRQSPDSAESVYTDSLRLSIAEAQFIHEDARWPLSVMRRAEPSAAYDTSPNGKTIVGHTVPPTDTVSTSLVPEMAGKDRFAPILPPEKLRFPGHDRLTSVPNSSMGQAARRLQQHVGTPYGIFLPVTVDETAHRYTLSFETQKAHIIGVSENVIVRETKDGSLTISREPRDS